MRRNLTFDATYPTFNVYGVDFSTAMQKVQTDLKAVGITLKLNPVEISVWADKIGKDGIPVTMLYFAPDHTDSSQYVQYFGLLPGVAMADVGARSTRTRTRPICSTRRSPPRTTRRGPSSTTSWRR